MTKQRVNTIHEPGTVSDLFDKDIAGLHKMPKPTQILTHTVRYLEPSLVQTPYMINFLIYGFKDLIMSDEEAASLNKNDIFLRVVEYVAQVSQDVESEDEDKAREAQQILGSSFCSQACIDYLVPVLRQSFPDINFFRCTNDCFLACFNTVFEEMFAQDDD